MVVVFLLVLLGSVYVESCRSTVPVRPLPAPQLDRTTLEYPNTLIVYWHPIPEDQIQKEYPLVGYNVSLWIDSRVRYSEKKRGSRPRGYHYPIGAVSPIPNSTPVTKTVSPDVFSTKFTIEASTAYQLRVRAFSQVTAGPYSLPETFKLLETEEEKKKRLFGDIDIKFLSE